MKPKVRYLLPAALAWLAAACSDAAPPTEPVMPVDPARSAAEAALAVRDRWIVVFHDRVARPGDQARELVRAHGGTLHFTYQHAIRGFAATLSPQAAEAIRRNPNVRYVEPDGISTLAGQQTQTSAPWGLDRTDQRALPLSGSYGYYTEASGQGVNAYVLDSGIRFTHAEFGGRAVLGADYVQDGRNGNDCNGHGTAVAGVLGGSTYGVAKGAKLVAVRVFGCTSTTYTSAVVAGLDWVRYNHVKPAVVNLSLTSQDNAAQDDAVKALLAAGVTVVSAAGNGGPSGVFDVCNISSAYIDGVITAGATDRNDARWAYSNIGYCMDVFAPGVDIPSASYVGDTNTSISTGTSMSAPHVAGAVARFLQTKPGATPAESHAFIVNNATTGVVTNPGYLSPNRLLFVDAAFGKPPVPALSVSEIFVIQPVPAYSSAEHSVSVSGGVAPYTFAWDAEGIPQPDYGGVMYYTNNGYSYVVNLTVTDAAGQTATRSVWVEVQQQSTCDPYQLEPAPYREPEPIDRCAVY